MIDELQMISKKWSGPMLKQRFTEEVNLNTISYQETGSWTSTRNRSSTKH
jgi:hypothetical protein